MTAPDAIPAPAGWAGLPARPAPVRLALIGISGYGRIYLQLVRELRERGAVRLVAAVVINPAEEAENVAELRAAGTALYADYEEMLRKHAGEIDVCLIPTGIQWHARMTIAALQAGLNVLIEKPLAGSLRDVHAIRAAELTAGRFVAVGFQDLYTPGTRWLKRQLLAGAIGRVRSVRVLGLWPRPVAYYQRNNWTGRLQVGGVAVLDSPLNNAFGHFANLALYFCGRSEREVATAAQVEAELFRAHAIESFDTAVVRARAGDDVRLWFGFTHACRELFNPEVVIEGTEGRATWSYEKISTLIPVQGPTQSHPLPASIDTRRVMLVEVLRRLDDPAAATCTTAMAEPHTALIEAVQAAAPVQTIAPALIEWFTPPDGTSPIPAVRGLEGAMHAAAQSGGRLQEHGFPLKAAASA
ncbi:MAG TPA: Gfo/Idh/MocA family oxidoreductase [Opitutaceae bacterium]|nr:Gfo/Idh/MocA family oxidoreductase [Opitutaceae bacterium]